MKIKKNEVNAASRSVGLTKIPQTIFSGQDYIDFALANSVLHFNDGKRKHVGIFSQMGWDVGIV